MSYLHSIVICNFCPVTDAELLVLEEDIKRTRLNATHQELIRIIDHSAKVI